MTPAAAVGASRDIAAKLQIKPGSSLWVSDEAVLDSIGPLPAEVSPASSPAAATAALFVASDKASLHTLLRRHRSALAHPSVLWVAYPKANRIDLSRDTVWPVLVEHDLRPIGQASIGDTWSAMRFRPRKPGEEAFTGRR